MDHLPAGAGCVKLKQVCEAFALYKGGQGDRG